MQKLFVKLKIKRYQKISLPCLGQKPFFRFWGPTSFFFSFSFRILSAKFLHPVHLVEWSSLSLPFQTYFNALTERQRKLQLFYSPSAVAYSTCNKVLFEPNLKLSDYSVHLEGDIVVELNLTSVRVRFGITCQKCLPIWRIFRATFARHSAL